MAGQSQFTARVLHLVRRIPPGRVATYGDSPGLQATQAPRAPSATSCERPSGRTSHHRVIAAGGRLGGYGGREALKRALLVAEGVIVTGMRVRSLNRIRWSPRAKN